MFSSVPLIFPPTVVGNITASVALILWTNGQLPLPTGSCGEERLKKLAPDHLRPGASDQRSKGREIFGLLNCLSSTASLARSFSFSLSLSLSGSLETGYSLPTRLGWGGVSQDRVWVLKVGMERGPSPLLSNRQDGPAPQDFPMSWDWTEHGEPTWAGGSLGSWGKGGCGYKGALPLGVEGELVTGRSVTG